MAAATVPFDGVAEHAAQSTTFMHLDPVLEARVALLDISRVSAGDHFANDRICFGSGLTLAPPVRSCSPFDVSAVPR